MGGEALVESLDDAINTFNKILMLKEDKSWH